MKLVAFFLVITVALVAGAEKRCEKKCAPSNQVCGVRQAEFKTFESKCELINYNCANPSERYLIRNKNAGCEGPSKPDDGKDNDEDKDGN